MSTLHLKKWRGGCAIVASLIAAAGVAAAGQARATPALERGEGVLLVPASPAVTGFQVLTGGASFGSAVSVNTDSTNDVFGNSLGDIDYIAVGEPHYNADTGRAWLYYRPSGAGNSFTRVPLIPKEGQRGGDLFGSSIAVKDGVVVVGAPGMGGVYIFSRNKNDQLGQFTQPYRDILAPGATLNFGRSVTYSGTQGGTVAACGDTRCRFYAQTGTGEVDGNTWAVHPNSSDSGTWSDVTGFKRALIVPGWEDLVVATTDPKEAGGNVVIFGLGSGANFNGYGGTGTVFPPGAGSWGNFTADAVRLFIGGPTTGVTTQFLHNPRQLTTSFGTVFNPTGSLQFGKQVAYSGNVLMVSDTAASGSSIVYRYQLNDHGTSNTTDDTWTLSGDFGTNDASYGSAMGLYGSTAAIGDPASNSVYVWDAGNPPTQSRFTAGPNNEALVVLTGLGSADQTTVTWDPSCTKLTSYIGNSTHQCISVSTGSQLFGQQKVCFPRGSSDTFFKCHQKPVCEFPETVQPVPNAAPLCCVQLLDKDTTSEPNKVCAFTRDFSDFALGSGIDNDHDGVPDIVDSCPRVSNPIQIDSDGDLIGDGCDNCPTIPNQNLADSNGNGVGDVCEASAVAAPATPTTSLAVLAAALAAIGVALAQARAARRASA